MTLQRFVELKKQHVDAFLSWKKNNDPDHTDDTDSPEEEWDEEFAVWLEFAEYNKGC